MKYLVTLVATLMLLTVVGVTPATAATYPEADWDVKIAWPGSEANQSSYWEAYFNAQEGVKNATCTKYEKHNGVLPGQYEAGVIKAGQFDYVYYQPDEVTRYLGGERQELSHIFKCNWETYEPVYEPARQDVSIACSNDPTQALVTYDYRTRTIDGEFTKQEWTRSITGLVFTAETVSLKGEGQKTWLAPLGLDMRGTVTAAFTLGNNKISKTKTLVCGEPKGPEQNAYVRHYGPKGDPWYRWTFFNPRDDAASNATCKVIFQGREGTRVIKRKLSDGQGFKTPWVWVRGNTQVREVCYEGGELAYRNTFRTAAPGYYGPLYHGFNRGYFPL